MWTDEEFAEGVRHGGTLASSCSRPSRANSALWGEALRPFVSNSVHNPVGRIVHRPRGAVAHDAAAYACAPEAARALWPL